MALINISSHIIKKVCQEIGLKYRKRWQVPAKQTHAKSNSTVNPLYIHTVGNNATFVENALIKRLWLYRVFFYKFNSTVKPRYTDTRYTDNLHITIENSAPDKL